ncbi:MAG: hypothetical protein ISS28_07090 [Candidatus Cloacimonetes bacterium]|nr:hypothetical protein [Actinomycetota bacterium]MBL7086841.1 hypothetical protein [Candidatus Cloacimonadota bacterium]
MVEFKRSRYKPKECNNNWFINPDNGDFDFTSSNDINTIGLIGKSAAYSLDLVADGPSEDK